MKYVFRALAAVVIVPLAVLVASLWWFVGACAGLCCGIYRVIVHGVDE